MRSDADAVFEMTGTKNDGMNNEARRTFLFSLLIISLSLLSLAPISNAFLVRPEHIETQDTGNIYSPLMNVDLVVDCDTKTAFIKPMDGAGNPIKGAQTFLFYTDYGYDLLGTDKTGANGIAEIDVVGNRNYLTALFIIRVDHPQYRSREIEFTYYNCFQIPPNPPERAINTSGRKDADPVVPITKNESGISQPTQNASGTVGPNTPTQPPGNEPNTNGTTGSVPRPIDGGKPSLPKLPCLPSALILLSVGFVSFRHRGS